MEFLCEKSERLKVINYFRKKTPSFIFFLLLLLPSIKLLRELRANDYLVTSDGKKGEKRLSLVIVASNILIFFLICKMFNTCFLNWMNLSAFSVKIHLWSPRSSFERIQCQSLTHFSPVWHFYTPWKRQKTRGYNPVLNILNMILSA